MPSSFAALDTGFPSLEGMGTEQQIQTLVSYLYSLLESLRYILHNLSIENFNETDFNQMADEIRAGVVISNTVITNEIYSDFGAVADLAVNELRSDYDRANRFLNGDISDLDYIHIHDETISFLNGVVKTEDGDPLTEQLHHGDRYFWWTDGRMEKMTSLQETAYPVMVYQYKEFSKGSLSFTTVTSGGVNYKLPCLTLGVGYGIQEHPERGRGFLCKNPNSFDLWYVGSSGAECGCSITGSGVTAYGPWKFQDGIEDDAGNTYPTRAEIQDMISSELLNYYTKTEADARFEPITP